MKLKTALIELFVPSKLKCEIRSINHRIFALFSGGLILSQILMGVTYYSGPTATSETPEIMSRNIVELTNKERTKAKVITLNENETLKMAAQKKLDDMFANNYWEHVSPVDNKQAWDFMKTEGYKYVYAGENLAKGFHDSNSAVNAWMNSTSHKENILSNRYSEIGVAIGSGTINGKPATLVVQLFAAPQTALAQTPATEPVVLGVKQEAKLNLSNPVSPSRIPYFVAWMILFILIVFDGAMLRRCGLHKSKRHMFEFRSALIINVIAFMLLFVNYAAISGDVLI